MRAHEGEAKQKAKFRERRFVGALITPKGTRLEKLAAPYRERWTYRFGAERAGLPRPLATSFCFSIIGVCVLVCVRCYVLVVPPNGTQTTTPPLPLKGAVCSEQTAGRSLPTCPSTTTGGAWNGLVHPGSGVFACLCLQSYSDTRGGTRTWVEGLFGSLWLRGSLLFCVSGSLGAAAERGC